MSGLPKTFTITSEETLEAFEEPITEIIQAVRSVLEKTPPELSSDIMDRGIIMTGGGSLLKGFPKLISEETDIPVFLADDPLTCVAKGTGEALEELDQLKDVLFSSSGTSYNK